MANTAAVLVFLLGSITLAAQSGPTSPGDSNNVDNRSPNSGMLTVWPTIVAGCPIDMHASQGLWDHTIKIREGESERARHPFGQRIVLKLKDPRVARIVAATLRVRGLNGSSRTVPTPAAAARQWNAIRTMRVNFVEEGDGTARADLWIGGFTAVGSIQLIDVSYSDGAVWRVAGPSACRVQPDPIMLITER